MPPLPPPRPAVSKEQLYHALDAISETVKNSIISRDYSTIRDMLGDDPFRMIWELTRPDAYCLQTDLTKEFLERHPQYTSNIKLLEHLSYWDKDGVVLMAIGHGTGRDGENVSGSSVNDPDLWHAIDKLLMEHAARIGIDLNDKGVMRADKAPGYNRGKTLDQQVEAFRADMDSIFETWKER